VSEIHVIVRKSVSETLRDVRAELMQQHTRAAAEYHQLAEQASVARAKQQRLQERINALDAAVFAWSCGEEEGE
jgi:chromosome segregation ATPase